MFLINDVYLTHTDISCSHHHNCSFSKPFLNKCREICLQLPNTTTSSEISWVFLKFNGSMKIVKWFPSVSTKLSSTQRTAASAADTEHSSGNYLLINYLILGAVYSSEVALEFAKAKSCLQLRCFCSE